MSWSFGKKESKTSSVTETIINLNEQITLLEIRINELDNKIHFEQETAKKNINNKQVAKQALTRKKVYEESKTKFEGIIFSLEQQKISIESMVNDIETIKIMNDGNKIMKKLNEKMTVDDVHNLVDDVQEQIEYSKEKSEALLRVFNEEEIEILEKELESWCEETMSQDIEKTINFPPVPNTEIAKKEDKQQENILTKRKPFSMNAEINARDD
jgi:charged multivesicular body protein 4